MDAGDKHARTIAVAIEDSSGPGLDPTAFGFQARLVTGSFRNSRR